jgi:hypothetical protein
MALGEGAFTCSIPPRALRREFTLGELTAVSKQCFAERMVALGEGSVSSSAWKVDKH